MQYQDDILVKIEKKTKQKTIQQLYQETHFIQSKPQIGSIH